MTVFAVLAIFSSLLFTSNGLFEDQIGLFDWRQQYLGKAKFSLLQHNNKAYFFGSYSNTVSSVNTKDGSINWRQVLEEDGEITDMMLCGENVLSISGKGDGVVRAWDAKLGYVAWEKPLEENAQYGTSMWCDASNGVVYISSREGIKALYAQNGLLLSSVVPSYTKEPNQTIVTGMAYGDDLFVFVLGYNSENGNSSFSVVRAVSSNHEEKVLHISDVKSFSFGVILHGLVDCLTLKSSKKSTGGHFALACLSSLPNGTHALHVFQIPIANEASTWTSQQLLSTPRMSPRMTRLDDRRILISDQAGLASVYELDVSGSLVNSYILNKVTLGCVGEIGGDKFLFTLYQEVDQPFKNLHISVYDLASGKPSSSLPPRQWTIARHHGAVESASVVMFYNSTGSLSFRMLLHTEDHAIQVVYQNGHQQWLREEALADIVAMEFVDLPVSESQARMEEEFGHTNNNLFDMFFKRCRTQVAQIVSGLSYWARELPQLAKTFFSSSSRSPTKLAGDRRGHHHHGRIRAASESESLQPAASGRVHSHPGRLNVPLTRSHSALGLRPVDDNNDEEDADGGEEDEAGDRVGREFLTRDTFNLHKMLVLVTRAGKVFGLESQRGLIVWEYLVPSTPAVRLTLFQQRNTAHFPLPPVMTLLFKSKTTGLPSLFSFNPITGIPSSPSTAGHTEREKAFGGYAASDGDADVLHHLPVDLLQAVLYPSPVGESLHFVRPIIMLDTNQQVHVYPSRETTVTTAAATGEVGGDVSTPGLPLYVYTVEQESARLTGYRIHSSSLLSMLAANQTRAHAMPVWRMLLRDDALVNGAGGGTRIEAIATKPASEHVHSLGRVLGDRSVLYKYLNPNLLAVLTSSGRVAEQTNMITVYLIDVVAGRIVYSANHRRCSTPVSLVQSENWVVYSCYKQQSLRNELTVLELFEATTEADGLGEPCAAHSVPGPLSLFLHNTFPSLLPLFTGGLPSSAAGHLAPTDSPVDPLGVGAGSAQSVFSSLHRATGGGEEGTGNAQATAAGPCRSTGSASPLVPRVLQQAYILGTPPRSRLSAVSLTERGITSKSIIFGLEKGALFELPKQFLDPRRTLDMTPELVEEGLPPYAPVLPVSDQAMLTYNLSVLGLRAVETAVTGLESTSVVFAYGLDLFFTRIAPSQTYDLLKDDFDYVAIATVTIGMVVASVVTQRLATRRTVLRAWT